MDSSLNVNVSPTGESGKILLYGIGILAALYIFIPEFKTTLANFWCKITGNENCNETPTICPSGTHSEKQCDHLTGLPRVLCDMGAFITGGSLDCVPDQVIPECNVNPMTCTLSGMKLNLDTCMCETDTTVMCGGRNVLNEGRRILFEHEHGYCQFDADKRWAEQCDPTLYNMIKDDVTCGILPDIPPPPTLPNVEPPIIASCGNENPVGSGCYPYAQGMIEQGINCNVNCNTRCTDSVGNYRPCDIPCDGVFWIDHCLTPCPEGQHRDPLGEQNCIPDVPVCGCTHNVTGQTMTFDAFKAKCGTNLDWNWNDPECKPGDWACGCYL